MLAVSLPSTVLLSRPAKRAFRVMRFSPSEFHCPYAARLSRQCHPGATPRPVFARISPEFRPQARKEKARKPLRLLDLRARPRAINSYATTRGLGMIRDFRPADLILASDDMPVLQSWCCAFCALLRLGLLRQTGFPAGVKKLAQFGDGRLVFQILRQIRDLFRIGLVIV